MFRPEIAADDDLRDRIKDYAEAEGIRMPRAYSELLEKGLQVNGIARPVEDSDVEVGE